MICGRSNFTDGSRVLGRRRTLHRFARVKEFYRIVVKSQVDCKIFEHVSPLLGRVWSGVLIGLKAARLVRTSVDYYLNGIMISRHMAIAVPLIAVILVGGLYYYYFTNNSGTVAMSIQPGLILKESYIDQKSGGFVSQYFVTSANIGNPGGIISNTTLLSDGVNGFYPLFTSFPPCANVTSVIVCTIHVQSKVVRPYTLGDFFNVWGEPLGRDNTLGYRANATGTVKSPFYWDMCIYNISTGRAVPSIDWGSHVLKDGEIVLLLYSQIGCL